MILSIISVKRYTLTPWKVAITGSVLSILFAIPHAMVPELQRLSLPFDWFIRTIYLILPIAALSIAWALLGIRRRLTDGNLVWCIVSVGLATLAIAFTIISAMSE